VPSKEKPVRYREACLGISRSSRSQHVRESCVPGRARERERERDGHARVTQVKLARMSNSRSLQINVQIRRRLLARPVSVLVFRLSVSPLPAPPIPSLPIGLAPFTSTSIRRQRLRRLTSPETRATPDAGKHGLILFSSLSPPSFSPFLSICSLAPPPPFPVALADPPRDGNRARDSPAGTSAKYSPAFRQ